MGTKKKQIIKAFIFLIVFSSLNSAMNFSLMPPSPVRFGLHNIYSNPNKYQNIFIGTSHGQYGIDPAIVDDVTGEKSTNLCMADQYPIDTYYLLKEMLKFQKPKKVIYEIDYSYWITEQRIGSPLVFIQKELPLSWNKIQYNYDKLKDKNFCATLFPWIYYRNLFGDIEKNVKNKTSREYKEYNLGTVEISNAYYKDEGFIYRNIIENEDKGTFNNIVWDETRIQKDALKYFGKIVDLCKKNSIELEIIVTPIPNDTVEKFKESYMQADLYFSALMKKNNLKYYNFNMRNPERLDRNIKGYWDYDGHMNGEMAEEFSVKLGEYLLKEGQ